GTAKAPTRSPSGRFSVVSVPSVKRPSQEPETSMPNSRVEGEEGSSSPPLKGENDSSTRVQPTKTPPTSTASVAAPIISHRPGPAPMRRALLTGEGGGAGSRT